jgi:putative ABC transport system permease protein
MIKNYFKTAFRNLWRNKIFSSINIFGLAFGLSCCLMMILFIRNELSYDHFNKNIKSIYRVAFSDYLNQGGCATTPLPVGPALKDQLPEIKAFTRISTMDPYLMKYGTNEYFEPISFGDEELFKIFSFPFIEGNPNTALRDPNSIVLSEQMAKKYFGNEDPLNKIVKIGSTGSLNSRVTGVFKKLPQNSQLQFTCLISFSTQYKLGWTTNLWQQMPGNYTYVLLNSPGDAKKVSAKLPSFVQHNDGSELTKDISYNLMLQPLSNIHLQSKLQSELPGAGNMSYIYLFGAIAIIILAIACINFVNFATANAIKRAKEIGIRKVIGAQRRQLIKQFLSESFITYLLAALIALLLAQLFLPVFNFVAGKSFAASDILQPVIVIGLLLIGIITGFVAGLFPAWSISQLSSIAALKGSVSNSGRKVILRKALVTVQFVASMALMVASAVVFQQMKYIRNQSSLKQRDQVIVFPINSKLVKGYDALKNQLISNSNILDVTGSTNVPGFTHDSWPIRLTENSEAVQTENYVADDNFFRTMNFSILAGRELTAKNATDIREGFVLNETAVHALGFKNIQDAIGRTILWGGDKEKKHGSIVGVVKDFHFASLHEKIAPALVQFAYYDWMTYNYLLVKLHPGNLNSTIDFIKKTVASYDANWLVDYKFFDENFATLHKKDEQQGQVFATFAVIAILISCLGLFGLTIYATHQRVKEIGIRKVLGASVTGIVNLLSKDFVRLIIIAAFIAFPISWWAMNKWLEDFAYRVQINWMIFLEVGISTILLALITVSFLAIKAANANPVKSLRTE